LPISPQLPNQIAAPNSTITANDWTENLGKVCIQQFSASATNLLQAQLLQGPGVAIWQHLIGSARSGTMVNALPWTSELLFLQIGGAAYKKILEDFWQVSPPRLFGGDEAADFASYLAFYDLEIPYLADILAYERAQIESAQQGQEIMIECRHDPTAIIAALANGELPTDLAEGQYQLQVSI
jgi:uncharacterized protein